MEGLGENGAVGTLSRLMQLVNEAIVVFDMFGQILLANDQATLLFCREGERLVNKNVADLFAPVDTPPEAVGPNPGTFSPTDLPFPVDGSSKLVNRSAPDGTPLTLWVRCDHIPAPGETYLMVALPADENEQAFQAGERELDELRHANHQLSGALNIVLDTLDSRDVSTLFSRVIDEITSTMEADATILYLAESDGYHLRGMSESLRGSRVPRFLEPGRTVASIAIEVGHSLSLRVLPPDSQDLRRGRLQTREVVNQETKEVLRVGVSSMPPFSCFFVVPVWFGSDVIAIIEVGWNKLRSTSREDRRLLDAVAHYLSVQLVGALSAMQTQRSERLESLGTTLREELLDASGKGDDLVEATRKTVSEAAESLDARYVPLSLNTHQNVLVADLPNAGMRAIPLDLEEATSGRYIGGVAVVSVVPGTKVYDCLHELGEPCVGALLDFLDSSGNHRACMLLREDGAEPLDELELRFLRRLGEDVRDISQGELAREQDKRISQALQSGMQNVLQRVDGITAHGIYSSATADAFVGGDFYDLIRLPGGRACVIMGDVSGKGVEAASVSAAVKTALGAYSWEGLPPASMVRSLNDFLLGFSRIETFATLFVGIIDLPSATLTYCSAGHPPAVLWRAKTGEIDMLDVQSGVVGAFHDMNYQDGREHLHEGDVLLLYTDGTTEARSPSGAFFGEDGLRDMVMDEVSKDDFDHLLERFLQRLDAFTGSRLDDDVAMVAVRFDSLGDAGEDEK
jgi:sigma-B regulation protein RsbU (phosphoserine phosphatase)